MTKGPTPRHSKPAKPVTIDLDATDVTSNAKSDPATEGADQAAAKAVEKGNPEKAQSPSVTAGGEAPSAFGTPGPGGKETESDKMTTGSSSSHKGGTRADDKSPNNKSARADAASGPKSGADSTRSKAGKADPGKSGSTASQPAKAGIASDGSSKSGSGSPGTGTTGSGGTGASSGTKPASATPSMTGATASSKPESSKPAAPKSASATSGTGDGKRERGGGFGMIASGVIGAVIALGGGYALQTTGMLPQPGAATPAAGETEQAQAVGARVDELAARVEALSAQPAGDDGAASLSSRIDALETAMAAQPSGSDTAAGTDQTGELSGRIEEIESRLDALADSASSGQSGADPALNATVSELQASQAGVTDALSQSRTRTEALASQVAALEQAQQALADRLDTRLTDLEARLDEPAQQVDLARAIAAAGLKTAIDRGGSFMSELEAFASVAPDDPAVPELRDLAASGVPSRSKLIEDFPDAANLAIASETPANPDAGLVDRLMDSALSVVKVRQVGDIEGDTAEAIAARAESRLLDGDLEAALAEWNTLPEASRSAAAEYGDALAARARAEKLIAASLTPGGAAQAGSAADGAAEPEGTAPAPEGAADPANDPASGPTTEAPAN